MEIYKVKKSWLYTSDKRNEVPVCKIAGMTKSNICVIVKKEHLTKVKVGVQNLIIKEEIDRVMENRMAKFGSYRLQ